MMSENSVKQYICIYIYIFFFIKLTSQDPLIIRPISAGVLLTATADRAVSPTLPAKYM